MTEQQSTYAPNEELAEAVFDLLVSEGLTPDGEVIARFDVAPIIATGIVRWYEERQRALLDVADAAREFHDAELVWVYHQNNTEALRIAQAAATRMRAALQKLPQKCDDE